MIKTSEYRLLRSAQENHLSANTMMAEAVTSKKNQTRANLMVCGCTALGATAQMLMKSGIMSMPPLLTPGAGSVLAQLPTVLFKVMSNLPLMGGLTCYGLSTGLLVLALRYGELSVLYPIIALTYVWVSLLSVAMFGESMNLYKALGLTMIVLGVTVLGRRDRSAPPPGPQ